MPTLTKKDRAFFADNGYVVIRNAVPRRHVDAAVAAILRFTGARLDDPATWYHPPITSHGIVETYHQQAAWNNRTHPRIHRAFAELLGTEKLWVSIDRLAFKPPSLDGDPNYDFGGFIHLDMDTARQDAPFGVQGVLALSDTDADMGGFQCIPGMHKEVEQWMREHSPEDGPFPIPPVAPTPIPMNAGDFVIWSWFLPHGNGHNRSDRPRMAQYMTTWKAMDEHICLHIYPAYPDLATMRQSRIDEWRQRRPPRGPAYPGSDWDRENLKPARLTPLGCKLLGLDLWDEPGGER